MVSQRCKQRPKFKKGNKVYPHCGLTCAKLAANNVPIPANPLPIPDDPFPAPLESPPPTIDEIEFPLPPKVDEVVSSSGSTCRTPGCTSPVFVAEDGIPSNYCTTVHKLYGFFLLNFCSPNDKSANRLGERGCISCRTAPMCSTSVLCQPCHDHALRVAPVIIKVDEDHVNYKSGTSTVCH